MERLVSKPRACEGGGGGAGVGSLIILLRGRAQEELQNKIKISKQSQTATKPVCSAWKPFASLGPEFTLFVTLEIILI